MIITNPPSDLKSARYGATATESTYAASSPPSMGNPELLVGAESAPQFPFGIPPPYYYYRIREKSPKSRTWLRFLLAFIASVSLYMIVSSVVRGMDPFGGMFPNVFEGEALYPTAADGEVLDCYPGNSSSRASYPQQQVTIGGNYAYRDSVSYSIPTSSDSIYFLSRGNHGHGSLNFIVAEDDIHDDIKVDILIEYNRPQLFQKSNICLLSRNNNERGVGFFTPRGISSRDPIRFTVVIKFPRSSSEPLLIKGLDTRMDVWMQSFHLDNLVKFNRIHLRSANSLIQIHGVLVENAEFQTNNAPITGSFTTYGKLYLKTSNGIIDINLTMKNIDISLATVAELETSNGFIRAPITLISGLDNQPATFTVKATTSNSPLTLSFPDAPTSPFSILNLEGSTSNSPVKTTLHPTFEGNVVLESSIFAPTIEERYVDDPSGQGRVRIVNTQRVGGSNGLSADVRWGVKSPSGRGQVLLKTSNGRNALYL